MNMFSSICSRMSAIRTTDSQTDRQTSPYKYLSVVMCLSAFEFSSFVHILFRFVKKLFAFFNFNKYLIKNYDTAFQIKHLSLMLSSFAIICLRAQVQYRDLCVSVAYFRLDFEFCKRVFRFHLISFHLISVAMKIWLEFYNSEKDKSETKRKQQK